MNINSHNTIKEEMDSTGIQYWSSVKIVLFYDTVII
jgi:hypothetical protein